MNLPNTITLARGALSCVIFVLLEFSGTAAAWWAFGLFVFAAGTDWLDGWIARRTNQVTRFGRVVDPFVDKILVCGTMTSLLGVPAVAGLLAPWIVVVVVARELLVTTLRGLAEADGVAFPADRVGKIKMVVQSIAVAALLIVAAGESDFTELARYGVWGTLVLTVWSGVHYCVKARVLFQNPEGVQ